MARTAKATTKRKRENLRGIWVLLSGRWASVYECPAITKLFREGNLTNPTLSTWRNQTENANGK
jgi:hypothetical protein